MFAVPRVKKSALQPPPKKRKTTHKIDEITFDKDARTEYLSGFRKRKQARIKEAKEIAAKKEREERIEMRKQLREERRREVEEHVQSVNQIFLEAQKAGTEGHEEGGSDSDEWKGLDDEVPEAPIDMEEEYIDEDRYTTVTVEAVSVNRDGLHKPGAASVDGADESSRRDVKQEDNTEKGPGKKEWPKKKKKTFRYETKEERRITQRREKAKKGRR
ncbi:nucleolar protein 12-domain-containing protein [Immersiella caudata]|uniref:Nucleolar protein 12-domain-containing protein n=1 Tax=Immersiella caudata TaxID=314043 RepID=A0AA39X3Y6_9PEZI|nr:nucleolar protein 12-domain-containing protein [Immersiella caudata]